MENKRQTDPFWFVFAVKKKNSTLEYSLLKKLTIDLCGESGVLWHVCTMRSHGSVVFLFAFWKLTDHSASALFPEYTQYMRQNIERKENILVPFYVFTCAFDCFELPYFHFFKTVS